MQTQTFNGQTLSEVASAVYTEQWALVEYLDDLNTWGCSEGSQVVIRGSDQRIDEILVGAGLTREQFNELVGQRISHKWAFDNNLFVDEGQGI